MRSARRSAAAGLLLALLPALPALAQPAPVPPGDLELRVQPGDTLIGIGRRVLADPSTWPLVARENRLRDSNRISPRSVLRIPKALVRSELVPAQVLSASGDVHAGTTALRAGSGLGEGERLATGADGNATVQLVDGTVLRLRSGSQLTLQESRRYPSLGTVRSSVQLEQGRVEVKAPRRSGGQPGFEVRTPQGVLGVRGTEFRVAAEASSGRSLGEVLEGAVQVDGAQGGQRVPGGFGSVVDAAGGVLPPVALLDAPDLRGTQRLHEQPLVQIDFPALAAARGYRAQVALEPGFESVLVDLQLAAPPLQLPGLADGSYVLRLRGRDVHGLEGRSAEMPFTLKARPEPPLPAAPAPGARLMGRVELRWTANPEARSYTLQVARDAAFTQLAAERSGLTDTQLQLDGLAPGTYHWRVRSLRAPGDAGPPGQTRMFELLPTPPVAPPPSADVSEERVLLQWPAQAGQQFDLQLSHDAGFGTLLLQQRLDGPGFAFQPTSGGRFFARLRTIEADGHVGPFGAARAFEVPPCLRTSTNACVRASGEPVRTLP